ncbi:hypothetical protein PF011_g6281 [Phytophthora fragariae]|uniref:Uncharacterized protein n=1 Tax=Phytophthora fragariae TaxID=53985 RepID=A0A6A3LJE5_9STRA|nr:hypothetical protein PF011_g6281 [Phytophthora fragariae]
MATRAPPSAPDEAEKSDVDSLLRLVRTHQRQHDDCTYDSSAPAAIRRCKTMLTKLRKLLPKLMRPVATLPADKAVAVLQDLCQLLTLLLGGGACPHSMTLFMESNAGTTNRNDEGNPAASGFPSYPTMATMLFYMVSFYTNEQLRQAQRDVRNVTLQMVRFLQRNDVYGFIHFFRDTVQLLEDCFLLEESLKNRTDTDVLAGGASIACYLDTAIHVYQDADGPLGAKSNVTLCGCMPITDVNQLYERREQLKQMLPSIHVSSYGMVVTLRESVAVLADRVIREHNAMLEGDQSFDRLCQLVELFVVKNEALVKSADEGFVSGAVSTQGADEVTRSTLRLLHTMLQQIFAQSVERDTTFVVPVCWEYLEFLELYQLHPKCHDLSSSENLFEVSYDYLRSSEAVIDAVLCKSVALRGPFLVYFVWSRSVVLNLDGEDSWRNALPWRVAYQSILQETISEKDGYMCSGGFERKNSTYEIEGDIGSDYPSVWSSALRNGVRSSSS